MAVKLRWIMDKMEIWAPCGFAEDWDNVGLLIGDEEQTVERVLVALDASEAVVREAVENRSDLIITHHPLLFNPVKRITKQEPTGQKIFSLIQNNIALYAAHTNLDIADGGPSDILCGLLGLDGREPLLEPGQDARFTQGRVGLLPNPMTLAAFAAYLREKLSIDGIRYTGASDQLVHKVAICAGDASGGRYMQAALKKNCDVYVTGDLRYHGVLEALELGLATADITHYASEAPVVDAIIARMREEAARDGVSVSLQASLINGQVFIQ